ncbi:MAG TPA: hypothetical protein PK511_15390 [Chitinophagales bacterium]|nr:hypothetical protein [Chitinophagales bacterium]HMX04480.1 hypothetical protein [Chitinophagales bacterium]HMZ89245.1 hypothetical protein [Chitinophagales bacterium]HNE44905.1 hypothetical protein [Chitinophagales bacterium]HNF69290.1 hypothetical protein [Chitinophagales bacterium]
MKLFIATMLVIGTITGEKKSASFVLRNESASSIPLVIPGVMNPNLSPMSNSKVTLEEGQEIFFLEKKKRYLLLEVSPELNGDTLIVNDLIKKRKQELDLN